MERPSVRPALDLKAAAQGVIVPVPTSFPSRRFPQESPHAPRRVVLAVGGRAIVRDHHGGLGRVAVTDDDGTTPRTTLPEGVEVEIMAWRPRRSAGALYQVRQTGGEAREGWITAECLEPMPRPTERRNLQVAKSRTRPAPVKTRRRTTAPVR
jgi:hypothetical protein